MPTETTDPFAALPDDVKRDMLTAYRIALFKELDRLVAVAREAEARESADHTEPEQVVTAAA